MFFSFFGIKYVYMGNLDGRLGPPGPRYTWKGICVMMLVGCTATTRCAVLRPGNTWSMDGEVCHLGGEMIHPDGESVPLIMGIYGYHPKSVGNVELVRNLIARKDQQQPKTLNKVQCITNGTHLGRRLL